MRCDFPFAVPLLSMEAKNRNPNGKRCTIQVRLTFDFTDVAEFLVMQSDQKAALGRRASVTQIWRHAIHPPVA